MLCMFLHTVLYAKLRSAKSFEVLYIREDKDRLMRVDGTRYSNCGRVLGRPGGGGGVLMVFF